MQGPAPVCVNVNTGPARGPGKVRARAPCDGAVGPSGPSASRPTCWRALTRGGIRTRMGSLAGPRTAARPARPDASPRTSPPQKRPPPTVKASCWCPKCPKPPDRGCRGRCLESSCANPALVVIERRWKAGSEMLRRARQGGPQCWRMPRAKAEATQQRQPLQQPHQGRHGGWLPPPQLAGPFVLGTRQSTCPGSRGRRTRTS